ncbi:peptide-N(4)-(N-acetyl-beta-glucosaminyl)asparagine amidase-like [Penaeus chinensis]|uniref:peptide-N(4)-(N-acetyl-beta- glucosaminyl)asparagine amidase-like n=1 Tax=Penaeus chinensis TaxID=139456 RepID=UPI001FB80003|nr:peptide-N(4)-(N-acetyl-beta-glucosaminyl)asparagine amidase-like [Penaeus chinensis]
MAELSSCVEMLLENDQELLEAAIETLLKIAGNILREPSNEKFRSVNLSSNVVERKLIPAVGALEILFLMGFEEGDDKLVLPKDDSLERVRQYQRELLSLRENKMRKKQPAVKADPIQPIVALTPEVQEMESAFKSQLAHEFERVLIYESPALQEKARQVLPIQEMHEHARKNLSTVNNAVGKGEKPLDFQDCVLVELLKWFKNDFFNWFDAPSCPQCQSNMNATGSLPPTDEDLKWNGNRVEGYSCQVCGTTDRFVRYNHPAKLLETRQGRCGEWANCFTLFCRTLGMDARYVHDHTDHVWTEVYSQSQGRWLHADSCENKMDTPLMYERGWGKKLNYIIAYSKDELVDVTWRYTANQKEVLKRRKKCRESWLVSTILEMNKQRQAAFPEPKRNFLEQRLVAEIAEFFRAEKHYKETENEGRNSGSLAWRLARGEKQYGSSQSYMFKLTEKEVNKKEFLVKYSPARDEYIRVSSDGEIQKGWQTGVKEVKDVFRKHETDWKTVYLARCEGTSFGEISWQVDWSETGLTCKSILIVFQHSTFENGSVSWQLCTGDKCYMGNKDGVLELKGEDLNDSPVQLELSAKLADGNGDCAWQHAQLFRQLDSATEQFPLLIHINFL